ncbi:MAG: nucleotidyltransferase family protein [Eubacterium sp.]|nr:nucleotidyltransferase family protein [Eubacterium sp.]
MKNYMIKLCRAFLYGENIALDASADYEKLYSISSAHNLSAVLFCVINTAENKADLPQAALKRFENDFYEAVVRYDFQGGIIAEIGALCEREGIRHVFFKGAAIRDLYPTPQARVMGDVDILLDPGSRAQFKKLLTENGFECKNANGNVYEYTKDGLLTEAHTKIISGKIGTHDLETAFENAITHAEFDGARGVLDNNYHFAYLIAHTAHHFWFYGAGVKLVLDLAAMLNACDIDLDKVLGYLEPCALQDFAKVMLTVCHKWFGCGKDYGANTAKTEQFLLDYGAFGNINRNKAAVITRKDMESGGKSGGTRLRLLLPSYEKMRNIPYIPFIDGRPYLLPAAWVWRICYNLRHRRAFVFSATENIGTEETISQAKREFAYFEEIGLL